MICLLFESLSSAKEPCFEIVVEAISQIVKPTKFNLTVGISMMHMSRQRGNYALCKKMAIWLVEKGEITDVLAHLAVFSDLEDAGMDMVEKLLQEGLSSKGKVFIMQDFVNF